MAIDVYYHVYLCDEPGFWMGIVNEQLGLMEQIDLIDFVDNLYITAISQRDYRSDIFLKVIESYGFRKPYIEFVENPYKNDIEMMNNLESDKTITENHTMSKIWNASQKQENRNILYLHTKGVTAHLNHLCRGNVVMYQKYQAWRAFLNWGVLNQWVDCITYLRDFDCNVAGANFQEKPSKHFSGNFWWARSDYIKTLPDPSSKEWWNKLKESSTDPWLRNAGDRFRDEQWVCAQEKVNPYEVIYLAEENNPAFKYLPRHYYGV